MAGKQVQRRRGSTAEHAVFTGANGETTVDTDKKTVVVHDGVKAGGYPLARNDNVTAALLTKANLAGGNALSGDQTLAGNLVFSGDGRRIIGDFTNSVRANRTLFQTSALNGTTMVSVAPNGTGTTCGVQLHSNAADLDNCSRLNVNVIGGSQASVLSDKTGTGSYLPLVFGTGGTEVMRLEADGKTLRIPGIGKRIRGNFGPGAQQDRILVQNDTAGAATGFSLMPNETGVGSNFNCFGGVDLDNSSVLQMAQLDTDARLTATKTGAGTATTLSLVAGGFVRQRFELDGSVNFPQGSQRIRADFTSTMVTTRAAFQSNVANGSTNITALPNGTGTASTFAIYGSSDPANSSLGTLTLNANALELTSTFNGIASQLPITFRLATTEVARFTAPEGRFAVGFAAAHANAKGRVAAMPIAGFHPVGADNWKLAAIQGYGNFGGGVSWTSAAGDGFCAYLTGTPAQLNIQFGANAGQLSAGVQLLSTATAWAAFSDERMKEVIEPIVSAREKLSRLRTVIGRYKADEPGMRRAFLFAQDVQKVLPEAVNADADSGMLLLAYTEVIPLLTAAVNEQTLEFNKCAALLAATQEHLQGLEARLSRLESL